MKITRLKVNSVQDREPTHFRFYIIFYKLLVFSNLFQRLFQMLKTLFYDHEVIVKVKKVFDLIQSLLKAFFSNFY